MNILIITPYYPIINNKDLDKQTNVVHFFAKEWVKKGHNVLVVHTYPHKLSDNKRIFKLFKSLIYKSPKIMELDGVKVTLTEWYRWKPSSFELINKQKKNTKLFIDETINKWGVNPDKIINHFPSSTVWLMKYLKKEYGCESFGVFHNIDIDIMKRNNSLNQEECLKVYSKLGFRSKNILNDFIKIRDIKIEKFIASSGIPETILPKKPKGYENKFKRLKMTFVGRLDKNKNVECILKALKGLDSAIDFEFKIIGDGKEKEKLYKFAIDNNISSNVKFLGKISRDEVFDELRSSDVFIMVSHKETLGLVYLEAMACGCIVIGSKNTGIDGIIEDGINGFLIDSNDYKRLSNLIRDIFNLNSNDINKLLLESYTTINEFSDEKMAERYLENIT